MQQLEKMNEFFNIRSESYDIQHVNGIDGGIESKNILASFLPKNTETLIDLGIGTGLELEEVYKRFPNIKVTGIDIAEKMLEKLSEKYSDKHIELHLMSYFDYDFGKDKFDAALSVMTLHHYTHDVKTALYKRICDSINKNGVYIECDYMISEKETSNPQEIEDHFFSEYERLKKEQQLDGSMEYHYDTPCTVHNQRNMLLNAGFTLVKEVWQMKNTVVLVATK